MTHPTQLSDSDPNIVVIVPTYNGAEFIGAQLDALFSQASTKPWHLIVVDNGSDDATLGIVESYRPTPVPMTVLELGAPVGVNAALNAGIAATRSDLILIAEHDDVVADGWMQAIVSALGNHLLVGSTISKDRLNSPTVIGSRKSFREDVRGLIPIADATGMGVNRTLWQSLNGFDETYRYGGNDAEFCVRAYQQGISVYIVDSAIVHYRIRISASSAFRQGMGYGRSTVRLYWQFGEVVVRPRPIRYFGKEVIRLCWWSAKAIIDDSYRMRLAYRGGLQFGFVRGSVENRRWFL